MEGAELFSARAHGGLSRWMAWFCAPSSRVCCVSALVPRLAHCFYFVRAATCPRHGTFRFRARRLQGIPCGAPQSHDRVEVPSLGDPSTLFPPDKVKQEETEGNLFLASCLASSLYMCFGRKASRKTREGT